MDKASKCEACGYVGGRLVQERSEDMDAIVVGSGAWVRVSAMEVCGGYLFAEDGPTACLRRMAGVR